MSDEGRTAQLVGAGPYIHLCACGKWGGWGFRLGAAEPLWWCYEHYPHKRETAQGEAARLADEMEMIK